MRGEKGSGQKPTRASSGLTWILSVIAWLRNAAFKGFTEYTTSEKLIDQNTTALTPIETHRC